MGKKIKTIKGKEQFNFEIKLFLTHQFYNNTYPNNLREKIWLRWQSITSVKAKDAKIDSRLNFWRSLRRIPGSKNTQCYKLFFFLFSSVLSHVNFTFRLILPEVKSSVGIIRANFALSPQNNTICISMCANELKWSR